MTLFAINPGVDHRNTIGKVAPGIFAQEGRCWRFIYENAAGHAGHCMESVTWQGRWRFTKGWTKVWSCERHSDELPWARRYCDIQSIKDGDSSLDSVSGSD